MVLMLLLAGMVRAGYHFIRLALLAAMGLAGMYMLHMLAQDYNKITNRPRPAVAATRALFRAITKRDVSHVGDVADVSQVRRAQPRVAALRDAGR